jgi:diguanylate cyclase (GGDEF)-like protein
VRVVKRYAAMPELDRSPVAEELARGFPWLRFHGRLEDQYRQHTYGDNLRQLRFNLAVAFGLMMAFAGMNDLFVSQTVPHVFSGVRLVALVSLMVIVIGVTFLPNATLWYPRTILVAAPLVLFSVVGTEITAAQAGTELMFSTLVLATIFVYYLVGLMFFGAVACNLLAMLAYVVAAFAVGLPTPQVTYNTMVLLFANLVGASVAYNLERTQRTSWLEARMLEDMAQRDGLTGIFNRRRFDELIHAHWRQALREKKPLALLLIDIDCFKPFNDRYGHQAGDEVLRSVAAVLHRSARRPLDLAARYGGEEFAVALFDPTRQYAEQLAQRILEDVRLLSIRNDGSTVTSVVTVSVGLAFVVPADGRSVDGFIQLADEALYAAKAGGRNRVQAMETEYAQLRTGLFRINRAKS